MTDFNPVPTLADGRPRCQRDVGSYLWPSQCDRAGKVERDGKSFCGVHDPVRNQASREKRYAAWKAKDDRRARRYSLEGARDHARNALVKIACEHRAALPAPVQDAVDAYTAAVAALNAPETPDAS